MTVRSRGISSRCSSTSSAGTRIAPGSLTSDSPQAFGLRVSIKANCSPRFILSFTSSTVTLVGSIISLLHIAPIIFSAVDKSTQAACRPAAIILPLVTSLKPARHAAALYGYATELYRTCYLSQVALYRHSAPPEDASLTRAACSRRCGRRYVRRWLESSEKG